MTRGGGGFVRGAVLSLALSVLVGACKPKADAKAAARPAVVQVGPENIVVLSAGNISVGPAIVGSLTPDLQATLRSELSGTVLQVYADRGQKVKRGQLLARIDDAALREALLSAQSNERSARLVLENAKRDAERSTTLEAAGAIAPRDVESSQRALAAAEATLADAQSRLTTARTQLDKASIRAPLAGAISDRPVSAGDVVQPGTAIITVVDPSSMRLEANVPAEAIGSMRIGLPVEFRVNGFGSRSFVGHIQRISPAADPATRQVRIFVTIPNARSELVAGLFASGQVTAETRRGLLAPSAAVDQRGATPAVSRLRNGKVERVDVQLGLIDPGSDRLEIRSGVAAGDTLLVGAAQGIAPGTPVRVIVTSDSATTAAAR
jgi:RND family efflux transporter MFP subunit